MVGLSTIHLQNTPRTGISQVVVIPTTREMHMPKTKDKRLVYDLTEAAELLGLSRTSVYVAAANGDIPTIRVGRLIRVPRAALHAMLDSAKPKTGEAA